MYSSWESSNPLLFGCGTVAQTGEKLRSFGCTKVIVVFDKGVQAAGIVDKVLASIEEEGIGTVLYDNVLPDPSDILINEAGQIAIDEGCDGVLAIGGGSAMDTGKGVRILLTNPLPINRYFMGFGAASVHEKELKPLIVVPTTAGTGSEASPGAVITESSTGVKKIVNCPVSLGIIDPELTIDLPADITAYTGIDAFAHALEAVTSRMPNRISETIGCAAISNVFCNLEMACKEPKNIEAREGMALAAALGTCCARGPFGHIPHAFGGGISKNYQVAHGLTVGWFIAETIRWNAPMAQKQTIAVAKAMGCDVPKGSTGAEAAELAVAAYKGLLKAINFPKMRDVIPNKKDLLSHMDDIYPSPAKIFFAPRSMTMEEATAFVERCYDEE